MATPPAFSDSNDNHSSSICCVSNAETFSSSSDIPTADIAALRRLSENFEAIFQSPEYVFCSDARILVLGSREVPIHRCILAARSPFFRSVFAAAAKDRISKFKLEDLAKDFDVGYDALVSVLSYLYTGRVRPPPEGVCVCVDEDCYHLACRPKVDFMVEVLYASFTFQIAELVGLYQRHLLDILDKVAIDDIPVILSVAYICDKACSRLLAKCIEVVKNSDLDAVTLEKALPVEIAKKIVGSQSNSSLDMPDGLEFPSKHVKRIHRALDSDDVELVRMLLKEGHTTLDDARALHYTVSFCDSKITIELLELGLADVNHRNMRGYTVLHVAAIRKDPKIIISLLTKGAHPSDRTLDGRKALQIAKRLTKSTDYFKSMEEGKASRNDRLCIEILEQAESRDPLVGEASVSLALAGDDLRNKLLYLENRVGLAKLLFPTEAKVAMELAKVDHTCEVPVATRSSLTGGNQGASVDLNDAPFRMKEEHLARFKALSRTVEFGKCYFPRCSAVLNTIMDNDDLANLAFENSEEQQQKRQRFMEIQDALAKAFSADKEENKRSVMSSSSSSPSLEGFTTTFGIR
ncbi:BTB/POZ domain and ankyrin repeat-containing protein NPR1 [Aristolochia californica]|uniref:BTB/POZ domain and ankyrin repeat-containing protein NPR1 n=1 Tax=Aristolochia californica TaxID=171875 RepID=UPI0035DA5F0B